jgi:hypothetical protein
MDQLDLLYLAYRKAKSFAYRDRNTSYGQAFADFESNLVDEIETLDEWLAKGSAAELPESASLGDWHSVPKALSLESDSTPHFFSSNPFEWWSSRSKKGQIDLQFRPIAKPSVGAMVLSAFWCLTAGSKFDEALDSARVYGNRLKRHRPHPRNAQRLPVNVTSHELFEYWPTQYAKWQRRGLSAMESALRSGTSTIAITMDLEKYYHRIDPSFLTSSDFLEQKGLPAIRLTSSERWLTDCFIRSFKTWSRALPAGSIPDTKLGLPVGLTMSPIVANVALRQFDAEVASRLMPLYYGRYVDDVFLVLTAGREFGDADEVLAWLAERLGRFVALKRDPSGPPGKLELQLDHLQRSKLSFVAAKQKIFRLQGEAGLDLIRPIREAMRRQSSEFRSMPRLPAEQSEMAGDALLVASNSQIAPDSLRKAEEVSLRRHSFSLLLRRAEGYADMIAPAAWADRRSGLLAMIRRHLFVPRAFMDFSSYWPRVVRLATRCGDWGALEEWCSDLSRVREELSESVERIAKRRARQQKKEEITTAAYRELFRRAWNGRITQTIEGLAAAVARAIPSAANRIAARLGALLYPSATPGVTTDLESLCSQLASVDWRARSYADRWLENEVSRDSPEPASGHGLPGSLLKTLRWADVLRLSREARLSRPRWRRILFPSRAPSGRGVVAAALRVGKSGSVRRALRALKAMPVSVDPVRFEQHKIGGEPSGMELATALPPSGDRGGARVIVTSIHTSQEAWAAAALGAPHSTRERLDGIMHLLDKALSDVQRWRECTPPGKRWPVYLVLPELSLPRRWAEVVTQRLALSDVSLIAGLEYDTRGTAPINEALVSLVSAQMIGIPVVIHQRKRQAAWGEQTSLETLLGHGLNIHNQPLRIYDHGGFRFGVAICSEFTEVHARSSFQGMVDAMFVPEWNEDVKTFSSIVEASAMDIHAFVVQANNREYGDSRIRAPFKEEHRRDVAQLKGGASDFYAIADIEYFPLRAFQTARRPERGRTAKFKPFPIGFRMDPVRERPRTAAATTPPRTPDARRRPQDGRKK